MARAQVCILLSVLAALIATSVLAYGPVGLLIEIKEKNNVLAYVILISIMATLFVFIQKMGLMPDVAAGEISQNNAN